MPWAAMLYAHIGAADAAALTLKEWKTVFNNPGHGSRHNPYYPGLSLIWKHPFDSAGEGEEEIMQMDGAAASVAAVLYMLCHERNGVIRLFFGAPSEWKDVSFENILTDGGFLVSATRRGGQIAGLTVTAMRNGTFRYTLTGKESDAVSVKMSAGETWRQCP
ncbi:MAG: hypothetical protein IKL85_07185 [Lentisphaeria bacterium]|nr:hypothetical protein [Lentisphaeria bacterium]